MIEPIVVELKKWGEVHGMTHEQLLEYARQLHMEIMALRSRVQLAESYCEMYERPKDTVPQ